MEWLTEGNEIVCVRSPDMVSVLQHITLLIHINFFLNYMSVQQCAAADPPAAHLFEMTCSEQLYFIMNQKQTDISPNK